MPSAKEPPRKPGFQAGETSVERHIELDAFGRRRIVEDSLTNRGIIVYRDGSLCIPHNPNFNLGSRWRGKWQKFNNLRDAIRAVGHARHGEFEAMQENRSFYARLLGIHRELLTLGRGSLDGEAHLEEYAKRKRLLKEYAQVKADLRLKRTERKVRSRDHFGVHEDDRGSERWGGRELLEKTKASGGDSRERPPGGNWPATCAVILKQMRLLKEENERISGKVLPVLRRREGLLRGYRQGHSERLEAARAGIDSALKAINSALNHEQFTPIEIRRTVSSARNAVRKLEYHRSKLIFEHLDSALSRVKYQDYDKARRNLKWALEHLNATEAKLNEIAAPKALRTAP